MNEQTIESSRRDLLLRAAYDLLKKCADAPCVISPTETTAFYDGYEHDGSRLIDDIGAELGLRVVESEVAA